MLTEQQKIQVLKVKLLKLNEYIKRFEKKYEDLSMDLSTSEDNTSGWEEDYIYDHKTEIGGHKLPPMLPTAKDYTVIYNIRRLMGRCVDFIKSGKYPENIVNTLKRALADDDFEHLINFHSSLSRALLDFGENDEDYYAKISKKPVKENTIKEEISNEDPIKLLQKELSRDIRALEELNIFKRKEIQAYLYGQQFMHRGGTEYRGQELNKGVQKLKELTQKFIGTPDKFKDTVITIVSMNILEPVLGAIKDATVSFGKSPEYNEKEYKQSIKLIFGKFLSDTNISPIWENKNKMSSNKLRSLIRKTIKESLYGDKRILAGYLWYEPDSIDKSNKTVDVHILDDEEEYLEVPYKLSVCSICDGNGKITNPSIDSNGISQEEFEQDPDFTEDYRSGKYDIECPRCNGKNVEIVPDYERMVSFKNGKELVQKIKKHMNRKEKSRREYVSEMEYGF